MFEGIDVLLEEKKKFQEKGGDIVRSALKEMFAKYPELDKIHWLQYTPYFNDGEPCHFSMREIEFLDKDENELAEYRGTTPIAKDAQALSKKLHGVSDLMESVFGEHAEVTVTRDNIVVEEYEDHD